MFLELIEHIISGYDHRYSTRETREHMLLFLRGQKIPFTAHSVALFLPTTISFVLVVLLLLYRAPTDAPKLSVP